MFEKRLWGSITAILSEVHAKSTACLTNGCGGGGWGGDHRCVIPGLFQCVYALDYNVEQPLVYGYWISFDCLECC